MAAHENEFYESYKDYGVIPAAIPPVVLILRSLVAGTYGNFRIVYVTVRSRSLRGTCNYLIALCSFADSVHMSSHVYFAYHIFSGKNFVTLEECYYVMSVPLVGLVFGQMLILLIGVDRLFCTIAPRRYQTTRKSTYMLVVVSICSAATALFMLIAYQNMQQQQQLPVLCVIVEAFHGYPMYLYEIFAFSTVIGSIGCYAFIWVYVRCNLTKADGCYGLGYLNAILFAKGVNATLVHLYDGIGINIGCSCNYYVLYAMSSEYRKDFKKQGGISIGAVSMPSKARNSISAVRET